MNITTTGLGSHRAFEINTGAYIIHANWQDRISQPRLAAGKKTRVYGALDALIPELMKLEPFAGNYGEDYYSIPLPGPERSAEDNVRAAMWHGWKRETIKVGTDELVTLLNKLFAAPIDGRPVRVPESRPTFSVKAGCSCPCSPGFILGHAMRFDGRAIDLWIEAVKPENQEG